MGKRIMRKVRVTDLQRMKDEGENITMLTCYDASFASAMQTAGIDTILIGDSLGMVVQGHSSTLPVTLEEMIYHTQNVVRKNSRSFIIADMPFGSYEASKTEAFNAASALMKAGAEMVKIEGGIELVELTAYLTSRGIPVCAHIGLLPQSVNILGGYRIQGKELQFAAKLIDEAREHQNAGAQLIVVECVPAEVGEAIAVALTIPVIGIGAGNQTDGQVLVMHDMLGMSGEVSPKFVKNFLEASAQKGDPSITGAFKTYVEEVKEARFPAKEHSF